uniref:Uncharacterized protein n=1 Tax=Utricularia reniformis TaxID=192314 RepID=A0A1Y0B131_9LAMI|nr:hypothetical protein AEK19_MT0901 [Utricularia reniformis]ART31130.1 hypothetical protein AEK19_MT0901 [Utricularia reniformis]
MKVSLYPIHSLTYALGPLNLGSDTTKTVTP